MKILFISHTYPPIYGGVEIQNFNLAKGLGKISQVKIIANGKGKIWLPIFMPIAFLKAFFLMTSYDVCLLGSGVLAPLGAVLSFFHPKKKFFCVIHGLDVIYGNRDGFLPSIYKNINIPSLNKLHRLFAVGNSTIEEAVNAGVDREKCKFIPNGVNPEELKKKHTRKELSDLFGTSVENKKVIFRLGRFVPHKGTSWFIDKVMPKLADDIVMVAAGNRVAKNTAGDQDDFIACEQAIVQNHLEKRVKLMPAIPDYERNVLLNTADIVISPNVKIPGSMEGFGINVIEAGACGRLVVASDLEGLSDAVHNGKNGFLVEPGNVEHWQKKIEAIFNAGTPFIKAFGEKSEEYVKENFSWDSICAKYYEEMKKETN